ncbi:MAG: ATP-dependent DNA ligase [bacterium]|nr:ATP-dependent DNA ligase [bacterium]
MKFRELSTYLEKIENTSSRLEITKLLSDLFKKLSQKEIDKTLYLLQGRIAPLFEKIEFGMGEKMIIKSVVLALNIEPKLFNNQYKKIGDLGITIEEFKKQIQSFDERDLSIEETFDFLMKLAKASGEGSQETKIHILANLLRESDQLSARYLARIPLAVMRMGFSDMTVLDAFSWMITGDKSLRPIIEKAYHVCPDLGYVGSLLKEKGIEGISHIAPQLFTPIIMMRAERLSSGEEIIKQIGECAIQNKFDGFRLQIHYSKIKKEVRLYSRNLEDVSFMYPDIVKGVLKEVHADEIIIEGEAIGFDPQTGSFLPFQETVQRKRKYDIEEKAKEIPLKLFAFEILYCDGVNYIYQSYKERRIVLEKHIVGIGNILEDTVIIAKEAIFNDPKKIELEFEDAISKGLEGIIAKKLDGIYQPGARGWNWIKFKRSYSSKIEDTIDCLVMGYDFGKGKRTGFGIGAFLVGVYDAKQDWFVTMAKIGTGLSDEEWKILQEQSLKFKVSKKPNQYIVDKAMECDVWIESKIVVEIKADEISRSPVHTAGRVLKLSKSGNAEEVDVPGYALRFPRLQQFRNDKNPTDATTLKEIEEMFKQQGK